jgi:hypothetical protein
MTIFNNYRFGVEIEFTGAWLRTVETEMQAILAGTNIDVVREGYNHNTRPHWKITTDATVTERRNYSSGDGFGGELVSPILQGEAGLLELKKVLQALNSVQGVDVDVRCGLHVHLSWDGMTTTHVKNIIRRYAAHEAQIDGWMPRSRKANNSRWCSSIAGNRYPLRDIANHQGNLERMAGLAGRYYKVNIQCLSRYGTVEFRQHSGTTDYSKISAWVKFLMGFCEASKTALLGDSVNLRYRASGKVYAAMRDQFANSGYMMKWARGHNWDVFDADGNHVSRKIIAELDAMYTGRYLNQEFADWFNAIVNTDVPADTVFAGVDTDTQDFLNTRAAQLAA